MLKKILPLFVLITLAACLFSYKLGSAPVALAKAGPTTGEVNELATPALSAPPAEWVIQAVTSPGTIASVTRAAGGAGVQHVVDCISATLWASSSVGAAVPLQLIDGNGTQWLRWSLPAASSNGPPSQISICGLNVVGGTNESMILEFQTNIGYQSVELIGHDAT